jgi:ribosomal protein L2
MTEEPNPNAKQKKTPLGFKGGVISKKLSKLGRRNAGEITIAHKGSGHKRQYRLIDFRRQDKDGIAAHVEEITYDPTRTAHIALLRYVDGSKRYIVAPKDLSLGDVLKAGADAGIRPGNNLPLRNIPIGTVIHAVELHPGGGAKLARKSGDSVVVVDKNGRFAQLRLPTGEIRNVDLRCRATIGDVGNAEQKNSNRGKPSRVRRRDSLPIKGDELSRQLPKPAPRMDLEQQSQPVAPAPVSEDSELVVRIGPFYDNLVLTTWLGITDQEVNNRVHQGEIISCLFSDGVRLFPIWQFTEFGTLLPGLLEVLRELLKGTKDNWTIALWLVTDDDELGAKSAVQWLAEGGALDPVLQSARHDAKGWAA